MGSPGKTKTWVVTQRRLYARGTAVAAGQQALRALKDAMISLGWTCLGSQTLAAGGVDGVDRWTSDAALKWGSSPGDPTMGWIVLRRVDAAGAGRHLDALIHLSATSVGGAQVNELSWYWGTGGAYVGGSTTTRPTYSGGFELASAVTAPWRDNGHADFGGSLTSIHATDGSAARFFLLDGNRVASFLSVETPGDVIANWTHPLVVSRVSGAPSYAALTTLPGAAVFDGGDPAGWTGAYWAVECCAGGALGDLARYANQITGGPAHEYALSPVGIAGVSPGKAGRHGRLADAYGVPAHLPIGFGIPAGSPAWVKLGDFVFPWDGQDVVTT